MGEIVSLVQGQVSNETVDALLALLAEARAGRIIGLAYVAIHPRREYSADILGAARQSPTFIRGTLLRLDDHLRSMID